MKSTCVATACSVVMMTVLASSIAAAHDKDCDVSRVVGTWTLRMTPQPNPDVAVVPPPFTALFEFETGGTITETDTGFHPKSAVELFPDIGPLSASDGFGAWEADRGNRYHGQFIKNLFDVSGKHIGYVITRIAVTLLDGDRLDATTVSDFVLGDDLNAEPFFTGGVARVEGSRLRAD